jgi:hypothetical protein
MGMWEIYCAICGGPFVQEATEKGERSFTKDEEWLGRVKVRGKKDICEYDMYGRFVNEKGKVIEEVDEHVSTCIHEECWKLNGKSFKGVTYSSGDSNLGDYQEQFFDWERMREDKKNWMMKDPSVHKKNRKRIKKLTEWLGIESKTYLIMYYSRNWNQDENPYTELDDIRTWFLIPNTKLSPKQAVVLDNYYRSDEDGDFDERYSDLTKLKQSVLEIVNGDTCWKLKGSIKNAKFDRLMEIWHYYSGPDSE